MAREATKEHYQKLTDHILEPLVGMVPRALWYDVQEFVLAMYLEMNTKNMAKADGELFDVLGHVALQPVKDHIKQDGHVMIHHRIKDSLESFAILDRERMQQHRSKENG